MAKGIDPGMKGLIWECPQCGESYEPRQVNQKYCTPSCREIQAGKIAKRIQRECLTCSTPFTTSLIRKVYCSQKCQREGYNIRKGFNQTREAWFSLREFVLERDGFACQDCNTFLLDKGLEAHHIKPLFQGGINEETNLITLCHQCHNARHMKTISKD